MTAHVASRSREIGTMNDKPRATCALSDDRQWLVVLYEGEGMGWQIYQFQWDGFTFDPCCFTDDTGQSAQEVLDAWLAGRTNAQAE